MELNSRILLDCVRRIILISSEKDDFRFCRECLDQLVALRQLVKNPPEPGYKVYVVL